VVQWERRPPLSHKLWGDSAPRHDAHVSHPGSKEEWNNAVLPPALPMPNEHLNIVDLLATNRAGER
jgi:hypothetical protein